MNDEPTRINKWGSKIWKNFKGQLHRNNDLPAVIWTDGRCVWVKNHKFHRDNNLPARIWTDGWCAWYQNDKFIKAKYCTLEEVEEYKKPYYLQKTKKTEFNRFKKLIK